MDTATADNTGQTAQEREERERRSRWPSSWRASAWRCFFRAWRWGSATGCSFRAPLHDEILFEAIRPARSARSPSPTWTNAPTSTPLLAVTTKPLAFLIQGRHLAPDVGRDRQRRDGDAGPAADGPVFEERGVSPPRFAARAGAHGRLVDVAAGRADPRQLHLPRLVLAA